MTNKSKTKQNQSGFSHIEIFIFLAFIIIICAVGWRIWRAHHSNSTSSQSSVTYLTYKTKDVPATFYVGDNGKVIAKVNAPSLDNYLYVYTRDSLALILQETHQDSLYAPATNQNYVLVNFNGTAKTLSSSISAILTSAFSGGSSAILDGTNEVIYSTCNNTSQNCNLNSVNLTTGATTMYLTEPGIVDVIGMGDPFTLLGESNNIIYYALANNNSNAQQLNEYSILTNKVIHSFALGSQNSTPAISNDYTDAIYNDGGNDGNYYMINLSTGNIRAIPSSIDVSLNSVYLWSPNDDYVAFTSPGLPASSTPLASINVLNIKTGTIDALKTFGDPRYNIATVYMWLSDGELYYSYDTTTLANDFGPPYDSGGVNFKINIQSGQVMPDPVPYGDVYVANEP